MVSVEPLLLSSSFHLPAAEKEKRQYQPRSSRAAPTWLTAHLPSRMEL